MADVQFVDNYVTLQRGMGNSSIFAWKTPTGEVYYGAQPRSETSVDTTSVARVSDVADTSTPAPVTPATTGAVQKAVAPIVPQVTRDSDRDRTPRATGSGDLSGWFSSTEPTVGEAYRDYKDWEAAKAGIRADLETPLGKAGMIAAPGITAVVEGLRHPKAVTNFFSSKATERRVASQAKSYQESVDELMGSDISDTDFWSAYEGLTADYESVSTGDTLDTQARKAVGLAADASTAELEAAQAAKAQADAAKAQAQREQTARLSREEASDSGYGRGGREGKAGGGTRGVAGGGTGGYGSPF